MSDAMTKLQSGLAAMRMGPGRRYSMEVRRQIRTVAKQRRREGARWKAIAEEIGIPHETIRRFSSEKLRGKFIPVEMATPASTSGQVVVVSPSGYRVEGMGVADAAELLRRLS